MTFKQKKTTYPKVSCLMVTANRLHIANRAIKCFADQLYPNKELIIVDDGEENYNSILNNYSKLDIKYIKIEKQQNNTLGYLRNCSLESATGDYIVQWDDDDWYHPKRLEIQAEILNNGYDACCLSATIVHISSKEYMNHPFIGQLRGGIPGSIMHKKCDNIRYSKLSREEDSYYLKEWSKKRLYIFDTSFNYLFIRSYHGDNTWDIEHFQRRLKNSIMKWLTYIWYFQIKKNPFQHPNFKLNFEEENSFKMFINESKNSRLL